MNWRNRWCPIKWHFGPFNCTLCTDTRKAQHGGTDTPIMSESEEVIDVTSHHYPFWGNHRCLSVFIGVFWCLFIFVHCLVVVFRPL